MSISNFFIAFLVQIEEILTRTSLTNLFYYLIYLNGKGLSYKLIYPWLVLHS